MEAKIGSLVSRSCKRKIQHPQVLIDLIKGNAAHGPEKSGAKRTERNNCINLSPRLLSRIDYNILDAMPYSDNNA